LKISEELEIQDSGFRIQDSGFRIQEDFIALPEPYKRSDLKP